MLIATTVLMVTLAVDGNSKKEPSADIYIRVPDKTTGAFMAEIVTFAFIIIHDHFEVTNSRQQLATSSADANDIVKRKYT